MSPLPLFHDMAHLTLQHAVDELNAPKENRLPHQPVAAG
jgi:hypothetical protein